MFLQDAAVLQDKYGEGCSVYTSEIFKHADWAPYKEQVRIPCFSRQRAPREHALVLTTNTYACSQVLAHIIAAESNAAELAAIAADGDHSLRLIGSTLQSLLGAVNEIQVAGRSNATAAAVGQMQSTLESIDARLCAAGAALGGVGLAAAFGRTDAALHGNGEAGARAAAAPLAAAPAVMPDGSKPFVSLEALGTVARLEMEWTVGIGAPPLASYDSDLKSRKAARIAAQLTASVRALRRYGAQRCSARSKLLLLTLSLCVALCWLC